LKICVLRDSGGIKNQHNKVAKPFIVWMKQEPVTDPEQGKHEERRGKGVKSIHKRCFADCFFCESEQLFPWRLYKLTSSTGYDSAQ